MAATTSEVLRCSTGAAAADSTADGKNKSNCPSLLDTAFLVPTAVGYTRAHAHAHAHTRTRTHAHTRSRAHAEAPFMAVTGGNT